MSLIYMTGFENGTLEPEWTVWWLGLCDCTTSYPRSGSYSLRYDQTLSGGRAFPNGQYLSEVYFQFANYFVPYDGNNNYTNMYFRNGSTSVFTLQVSVLGTLNCWLGSYGTWLAAATTRQNHDEWRVYEIHLKIHPTAGILEIKVDGVLEASYYGNTKYSTFDNFNQFGLPGKGTGNVASYVDDIVVNDPTGSVNNSWPGGFKIIRLAPTGDGAFKQWTPTPDGLTHYTLIDEVPPSSTDYLSSSSTTILDTFTHPSLPANTSEGRFILKNDVWAKKAGVSDSISITPAVRIGSTNYFTTIVPLSTTYSLASGIWETNPAGGTWDITTINNLEFGF